MKNRSDDSNTQNGGHKFTKWHINTSVYGTFPSGIFSVTAMRHIIHVLRRALLLAGRFIRIDVGWLILTRIQQRSLWVV